jgi:cell division protein FtsQ
LVLAAYIVVAGIHARRERAAITVRAMRVAVVDTTRVLSTQKVINWLAAAKIDPIGVSIDNAPTRLIETTLSSHPEVRHVSAWTDLEGTLTVRVEPRIPALRVRTTGGYRFWYTTDGHIVPDRGDVAAHIPIVTGTVYWPFTPSASGDYARMQADSRADFRERFTALADQRKTLDAQHSRLRAEIRTLRNSSPGRLRSQTYKKMFAQSRAARLAELESERVKIAPQLAALDRLENSLREKEKKSHQSHLFLTKLATFVQFLSHNDFWSSQVVQICVGGGTQKEDDWREPQLELIPRAGDHVILLGELNGTEARRLENLRLFYNKGLWHEGWNKYSYINIKYGNQIVCIQ